MMREEMTALEQQIQQQISRREENQVLASRVKTLEDEKEAERMNAEALLQEKQGEVDELQQALEAVLEEDDALVIDLTEKDDKIDKLQLELDTMQGLEKMQTLSLPKSVAEAQKESENTQKVIATLQGEADCMYMEMAEVRANLARAEVEVAHARKEADSTRHELNALKGKAVESHQERQRHQSTSLVKPVVNIQKLDESKMIVDKNDIFRLQAELTQARQEADDANQELILLEAKYAEQEVTGFLKGKTDSGVTRELISTLMAETNTLRKENLDLKDQLSALSEIHAKVESPPSETIQEVVKVEPEQIEMTEVQGDLTKALVEVGVAKKLINILRLKVVCRVMQSWMYGTKRGCFFNMLGNWRIVALKLFQETCQEMSENKLGMANEAEKLRQEISHLECQLSALSEIHAKVESPPSETIQEVVKVEPEQIEMTEVSQRAPDNLPKLIQDMESKIQAQAVEIDERRVLELVSHGLGNLVSETTNGNHIALEESVTMMNSLLEQSFVDLQSVQASNMEHEEKITTLEEALKKCDKLLKIEKERTARLKEELDLATEAESHTGGLTLTPELKQELQEEFDELERSKALQVRKNEDLENAMDALYDERDAALVRIEELERMCNNGEGLLESMTTVDKKDTKQDTIRKSISDFVRKGIENLVENTTSNTVQTPEDPLEVWVPEIVKRGIGQDVTANVLEVAKAEENLEQEMAQVVATPVLENTKDTISMPNPSVVSGSELEKALLRARQAEGRMEEMAFEMKTVREQCEQLVSDKESMIKTLKKQLEQLKMMLETEKNTSLEKDVELQMLIMKDKIDKEDATAEKHKLVENNSAGTMTDLEPLPENVERTENVEWLVDFIQSLNVENDRIKTKHICRIAELEKELEKYTSPKSRGERTLHQREVTRLEDERDDAKKETKKLKIFIQQQRDIPTTGTPPMIPPDHVESGWMRTSDFEYEKKALEATIADLRKDLEGKLMEDPTSARGQKVIHLRHVARLESDVRRKDKEINRLEQLITETHKKTSTPEMLPPNEVKPGWVRASDLEMKKQWMDLQLVKKDNDVDDIRRKAEAEKNKLKKKQAYEIAKVEMEVRKQDRQMKNLEKALLLANAQDRKTVEVRDDVNSWIRVSEMKVREQWLEGLNAQDKEQTRLICEEKQRRVVEIEKELDTRKRDTERIIVGMRHKMSKMEKRLRAQGDELAELHSQPRGTQEILKRLKTLEAENKAKTIEIETLVESKDADPRIARFGFRALQNAPVKIPESKVVVRYTKQEPVPPSMLFEAMGILCSSLTDLKIAKSVTDGMRDVMEDTGVASNEEFFTRLEESKADTKAYEESLISAASQRLQKFARATRQMTFEQTRAAMVQFVFANERELQYESFTDAHMGAKDLTAEYYAQKLNEHNDKYDRQGLEATNTEQRRQSEWMSKGISVTMSYMIRHSDLRKLPEVVTKDIKVREPTQQEIEYWGVESSYDLLKDEAIKPPPAPIEVSIESDNDKRSLAGRYDSDMDTMTVTESETETDAESDDSLLPWNRPSFK